MSRVAAPLLLLCIGLAGGTCAALIGLPIPYLLGSLISVGAFVILASERLSFELSFPMKVREAFVAVIGIMIGSTFTPEGVAAFKSAWATLSAVLLFIAVCLAANYAIFTKLGRYSRPTAFYASMPGGLVDSVTLGEQAGGDPRILTIQHFVRIVLIVTLVPLGFWAVTGEAVGSAAGVTLGGGKAPLSALDWAMLAGSALVGYFGGRAIGLPAYFLMGPLVVAAVLHGAALTDAQLPDWMLWVAQLVVGTGFGARFAGMNRAMLTRGLGLGLLSTAAMLAIGGALAYLLTAVTDEPWDVLLLCFAPGGITEMGLVALSLNANPVFVTAHHLLRIVVTVAVAGFTLKWVKDG